MPELTIAIEEYLDAHNEDPKPFAWTAATAESILEKFAPADSHSSKSSINDGNSPPVASALRRTQRVVQTSDGVNLNSRWEEGQGVIESWNSERTSIADLLSFKTIGHRRSAAQLHQRQLRRGHRIRCAPRNPHASRKALLPASSPQSFAARRYAHPVRTLAHQVPHR
jgi:hypothetical protein